LLMALYNKVKSFVVRLFLQELAEMILPRISDITKCCVRQTKNRLETVS